MKKVIVAVLFVTIWIDGVYGQTRTENSWILGTWVISNLCCPHRGTNLILTLNDDGTGIMGNEEILFSISENTLLVLSVDGRNARTFIHGTKYRINDQRIIIIGSCNWDFRIGMADVENTIGAARVEESDLIGMWELESVQNMPRSELIQRFALFNYGVGLDCIGSFSWRLIGGNRLSIDGEIIDIELSEDGSFLIFHYSGYNYPGQFPEKGRYIRR